MKDAREIPLRRFKALLVVDLEATCWAEGRGPREDMETIEFGAVLVRMSDLQPIDERSWFIKPKLHPVLSEFCTQLTSITQGQVNAGLPFEKVSELIAEWLEPHRERLGWGSWGNYDKHQLHKDAARLGIQSPLEPFPHRNLKVAFAKQHGLGKWRPGMRAALELCGLAVEGAHHRGIDDARNIARMLPFILDRKRKQVVKMNLMKRASQKRDYEIAARGAVPPEAFLFLRPDKIKDVRLEWPDVGLLDPKGEDRNR
jgi:inhibitor of KinA sporulation pathway (predicted exonuclease)